MKFFLCITTYKKKVFLSLLYGIKMSLALLLDRPNKFSVD